MRETTRRRALSAFSVAATTALATPVALATFLAPAPPAAAESAPAPVSIMVETSGTAAPAYRIAVRNDTDRPVTTTVRQGLPRGTPPTAVSGGGDVRPTVAGDRAGPPEVIWQVQLPARGMTMLGTTLAARPPGSTVTAPACAYASDSQAYDCAAATWVAPPAPVAHTRPWWQRETVLVGVAAALLVGLAAARFRRGMRQWRAHRRKTRPADESKPVAPPAHPDAARRRSPPHWGVRPTKPATALVVGIAVALLTVTLALSGVTGGQKVTAMNPNARPTSGAWLGRTMNGDLGTTLKEAAFEFTVYRLACNSAGMAKTRTCLVTVELRNVSGSEQLWHAGMQRIYLPNGTWVSADDDATRAANGGRDLFADPIPAGDRRLVALAFTVPTAEPPVRLELRSGAFSAGVSVPV
jgi:hypothetical protein